MYVYQQRYTCMNITERADCCLLLFRRCGGGTGGTRPLQESVAAIETVPAAGTMMRLIRAPLCARALNCSLLSTKIDVSGIMSEFLLN